MSEMGHSRPMHSVPVPINVRCYSNSDIIVRRSEVTLRAKSRRDRPLSVELALSALYCQTRVIPGMIRVV